MRTSHIFALAIGLVALSGCNQSPREESAETVEANADARAENIEEAAENQADLVRNLGEESADAVRNGAGAENVSE